MTEFMNEQIDEKMDDRINEHKTIQCLNELNK